MSFLLNIVHWLGPNWEQGLDAIFPLGDNIIIESLSECNAYVLDKIRTLNGELLGVFSRPHVKEFDLNTYGSWLTCSNSY